MSIFDDIKSNPDYSPNNSVNWFRKNVAETMKNIGTQQFLGMHQSMQTRTITVGGMVMFGYSPKFKDDLPYYDKFPLILPFNADAKHFWGINLHYLPPQIRLQILDKLYQTTTPKIGKNTSIHLTWEMLKAISMHKAIKHSVKCYLRGYVKTRFVQVETENWPLAVFLPLARFEKKSENQVWSAGGF